MELITERKLIQSVAARWAMQYPERNWPDKQGTLKKLQGLNTDTATVTDVEKIVGNKTWTRLYCHECGEQVTEVMQIGESPDYESATANICRKCILEAAASFT